MDSSSGLLLKPVLLGSKPSSSSSSTPRLARAFTKSPVSPPSVPSAPNTARLPPIATELRRRARSSAPKLRLLPPLPPSGSSAPPSSPPTVLARRAVDPRRPPLDTDARRAAEATGAPRRVMACRMMSAMNTNTK